MDTVKQNHSWNVAISYNNAGEIRGVLPYFKGHNYGTSTSIQALLTAYLGPYLIYPHNISKINSKYSFELKVMKDLISQLPKVSLFQMCLRPELENWLPFYFADYQQSTKYTYRIHPKEEAQLLSQLKSNTRNEIQKAESVFRIDRTINVDLLFRLNEKTFSRKGQKVPFDKSFLIKLIDVLQQHKCVDMYSAFKNEREAASILMIHDQKSSYCISIGLDKSVGTGGAVKLLLWQAIKEASSKGRIFDFEGSMIPEVEPVFRSFGGIMTPYHVISKCNRWLAAIFNIWKGHNF